MEHILAEYTVSISELKTNPSEIIEQASGETVAILNRNKPTAYMVSPKFYEKLLEALDELELTKAVRERLKDEHKAVEVSLDDL
jgi:antitoxin StbD